MTYVSETTGNPVRRPIILSLNNQKGGVAKSSSAVALAAIYAKRGLRVLLLDNDPQANASSQLGFGPNEVRALGSKTISQLYLEETPLNEVISPTAYANLWLVPSSLRLAEVEMNLPGMSGSDQRLSAVLSQDELAHLKLSNGEGAFANFDLIVIDNPPNLGKLCANSLNACSHFLVPLDAVWGLDSVAPLLKMVRQNSRYHKTTHEFVGVFFTLTDATNITRIVREEALALYPNHVLSTNIPRAKEGREAPAYNKPVPCYAPKSKLALSYGDLAEEVAARIGLALPATAQAS